MMQSKKPSILCCVMLASTQFSRRKLWQGNSFRAENGHITRLQFTLFYFTQGLDLGLGASAAQRASAYFQGAFKRQILFYTPTEPGQNRGHQKILTNSRKQLIEAGHYSEQSQSRDD